MGQLEVANVNEFLQKHEKEIIVKVIREVFKKKWLNQNITSLNEMFKKTNIEWESWTIWRTNNFVLI